MVAALGYLHLEAGGPASPLALPADSSLKL
jgi:hypothetical protein